MRLALLSAVALLAAGTVARAEVPIHGPPATAAAILKADRDFCALSVSEGTAKAFRDTVDLTDSRAFAGVGDPVRGSAAIFAQYAKDSPPGTSLTWEPSEAFAGTGDMGVTWGRWTFTLPKGAGKNATGRYVTVWRKDAAGVWKALIDIGNPDPASP